MRRESRRLRRYHVSHSTVLFWLQSAASGWGGKCVMVPQAVNLPADGRVLGVHEDTFSESFSFVVESATFDEVPLGHEIPRCGDEVEWKVVPLPTRDLLDQLGVGGQIGCERVTMTVAEREKAYEAMYPRHVYTFNSKLVSDETIAKLAAAQTDRTNIIIPKPSSGQIVQRSIESAVRDALTKIGGGCDYLVKGQRYTAEALAADVAAAIEGRQPPSTFKDYDPGPHVPRVMAHMNGKRLIECRCCPNQFWVDNGDPCIVCESCRAKPEDPAIKRTFSDVAKTGVFVAVNDIGRESFVKVVPGVVDQQIEAIIAERQKAADEQMERTEGDRLFDFFKGKDATHEIPS